MGSHCEIQYLIPLKIERERERIISKQNDNHQIFDQIASVHPWTRASPLSKQAAQSNQCDGGFFGKILIRT